MKSRLIRICLSEAVLALAGMLFLALDKGGDTLAHWLVIACIFLAIAAVPVLMPRTNRYQAKVFAMIKLVSYENGRVFELLPSEDAYHLVRRKHPTEDGYVLCLLNTQIGETEAFWKSQQFVILSEE